MADEENTKEEPIFKELQADSDTGLMTLESLCMNCNENGETRLLLVKIPFFKQVILSSFECEHCGEKNCEIQSGASIQDKGSEITLKIHSKKDLDRQIVKQESASFSIPELNFEAPPFTQKGEINTLEGMIARAVQGLKMDQPVRKVLDPESANKIETFLVELNKCLSVEKPFTVVLNDITGNSFIENPHAPNADPHMTTVLFERTPQQTQRLGLQQQTSSDNNTEVDKDDNDNKSKEGDVIGKDEVMVIPSNCSACQSPAENRMKLVSIPHFKEVIIMAITCDACGYKSNEVKSGAGIEPKGRKLNFKITVPEDLSRDLLKSETCYLSIPELDFEATGSTLGGKFTTIEGLLCNIADHLKSVNPFGLGDSCAINADKMQHFLQKLEKISSGQLMGVHIILDDPAGNSYIQNFYAPDSDPELIVEQYERTKDQNDELGLDFMKTENYQQD